MTDATDLFLGLTPDAVLDAIEAGGVRCGNVCHPLNSFENRVYEVELRDGGRLIAKFYRPGRWTQAQILAEHAFLTDLQAEELAVCPLRPFPDGSTLKSAGHIYFCLFDRCGGRAPEELDAAMAERLGMLVGRMHVVGARSEARHRIRLTADSYVRDDLDWLLEKGKLPETVRDRYTDAAFDLADIADARMAGVPVQRIHGDLHLGNLIERNGILHALDFDDMVVGPPVQDLWLLLPGKDPHTGLLREAFLEGYGAFRPFDRSTLRLIEPLRGLRLVHYAAWLARRWHDPIFPQTWPQFGTPDWWEAQTHDLEELVAGLQVEDGVAAPVAVEEGLTNKDLFWDWDER